MLEKTRSKAQISRREEPKAADKTEVTMRKLHAIKNELCQLKLQFRELRLFLEDKYEVLSLSSHGFAELNTRPNRKVDANDPFGTETSIHHAMFFPMPMQPETPNEKQHQKPFSNLMTRDMQISNVATLSMTASGLTMLAWVGWLTWYDMTAWSKDVITIFFGSRTGEAMSLGIGMRAIHYFAAGTVLLLFGLINSLRGRRHQTTKIRTRALRI